MVRSSSRVVLAMLRVKRKGRWEKLKGSGCSGVKKARSRVAAACVEAQRDERG